MKKLTFTQALLLMSLTGTAQHLKEAEVPAPIAEVFKKTYPDAKGVKWEKEKGDYEAEFKSGGSNRSVLFNAGGAVLESETEISVQELPASIKQYMDKNHGGTKITEAAKIIGASGELTYEVEIKKKDLIFDSEGNFLREEADED